MISAYHKPSRINILEALRRQFLLVLTAGSLTFLVLGGYIYFTGQKSYTAAAELRIEPVISSMVPGYEMASNAISMYYDAYVSTQRFKIIKRANIEKALNLMTEDLRKNIVPDGKISEETVAALMERIVFVPPQNSLIMTIILSSPKPDGIAEFLKELVDVYLEDQKRERFNQESTKIDFSLVQKKELEERIEEINQKIKKISTEVSTGNFSMEDTPYKAELRIQSESSVLAENARVQKEKTYNEFIGQMDVLVDLTKGRILEERLREDSIFNDQRKVLVERIDTYMIQYTSLPEDNPARIDVMNILNFNQDKLKVLEGETRKKYLKDAEKEAWDELESTRLTLFRELVVAKHYEETIKLSLKSIQSKYSDISKKFLDAQALQSDLVLLKAQLDRVNSSLNYFEGEQKSSGRISVENYPTRPIRPDRSGFLKAIIVAFLISFGWIFTAAVAYEFLDARIKSTVELRSFTGMKPSWPISDYKGRFLDLMTRDPHSTSSRAIESLAIRLDQERRGNKAKTISFNGINRNSGSSEILINTARGLKGNCDKILIIDLMEPQTSIRSKLGIPEEYWMEAADRPAGEKKWCPWTEADGSIHYLVFDRPEEVTHKRFERIYKEIADYYDLVLVDAPPVLQSPLGEYIFSLSDVAAFIIHGYHTTYPDLLHTLELASRLGIRTAALVLNWWKPKKKETKPWGRGKELLGSLLRI